MQFKDRADAGRQLAQALVEYRDVSGVVVLGLARGGVVTAAEVASALKQPLDVIVVRKIGAPFHEELAIGAITHDGSIVRNDSLIRHMGISEKYITSTAHKELEECKRRVHLYRLHFPAISLANKIVLLVDDGIATGFTMQAAIQSAREQKAGKVIVAVPVLPADTVKQIKRLADKLIFLDAPEEFLSIGGFYDDFVQVEHDDVIAALKASSTRKIGG